MTAASGPGPGVGGSSGAAGAEASGAHRMPKDPGGPGQPGAPGPGVFADLVGQDAVVAELRNAAAAGTAVLRGEPNTGMTHAWLFTGPPGSGRSVAARAFAAALLCRYGGWGQGPSSHHVRAGTPAAPLPV